MPGPTHAPERRPRPRERRPIEPPAMSPERRRRLQRTLIVGAVLFGLLLWVIVKAFGDGSTSAHAGEAASPTPAQKTSAPANSAPSTPSSASPSASSTSTATPSADPTTVPKSGDGKLTAVAIPGSDTERTGRTVTFNVEVEGGLGIDPARFATKVRQVLSDQRGWEPLDKIHFVAVSPEKRAAGAQVDIRITLASSNLTDQLCAPLRTGGEVSCNHDGRAVINAMRWAAGVSYYDDLDAYRNYVINHEVGHGLWHPHAMCPGPGQKAPIMQQQTLGLQGCTAWPWPST
jgi:hypothetical protein